MENSLSASGSDDARGVAPAGCEAAVTGSGGAGAGGAWGAAGGATGAGAAGAVTTGERDDRAGETGPEGAAAVDGDGRARTEDDGADMNSVLARAGFVEAGARAGFVEAGGWEAAATGAVTGLPADRRVGWLTGAGRGGVDVTTLGAAAGAAEIVAPRFTEGGTGLPTSPGVADTVAPGLAAGAAIAGLLMRGWTSLLAGARRDGAGVTAPGLTAGAGGLILLAAPTGIAPDASGSKG
jgi:hypothetical protein